MMKPAYHVLHALYSRHETAMCLDAEVQAQKAAATQAMAQLEQLKASYDGRIQAAVHAAEEAEEAVSRVASEAGSEDGRRTNMRLRGSVASSMDSVSGWTGFESRGLEELARDLQAQASRVRSFDILSNPGYVTIYVHRNIEIIL